MAKVTNISPQGALELPLIGRVIEAGETFDVTPEQAALLAEQPDVWQVKPTKATRAAAKKLADDTPENHDDEDSSGSDSAAGSTDGEGTD